MKADISEIYLHSKNFAALTQAYSPITELEDGVVYVKTYNESQWNEAVARIKQKMANGSMCCSGLMKCDIDILPTKLYPDTDALAAGLMGTEYNIVMPLFLPDRGEQFYFVGNVTNEGQLEPAASLLSADAQKLMEACLPYALSEMPAGELDKIVQEICERELADGCADWAQRLGESLHGDLVVCRGLAISNPMAVFGDAAIKAVEAIKNGLVSYPKRRKMIMNIPAAAKKMNSKDPKKKEEGNVELAMALQAMSIYEWGMIIKHYAEKDKGKTLKEIAVKIADRETLGKQTKYHIVFKPWKEKGKEFGFSSSYNHCMFVADNNTLYPVRMNKIPMTIYTMSLIEKVTVNKKDAIVDVRKNEKAFKEVYKFLRNDFNETDVKKMYDDLFYRNGNHIRTGRLTEYYKDIEASLQKTFMNLDDLYSPFWANANTPLAITADKIELPEELKTIKIR